MSDDDPAIRALEKVVADPNARPSTKAQTAKELAELRPPVEGPQAADGDPRVAMEAVVARIAPDPPELEKVAADPMRDLEFEALARSLMDPRALSWLPYLPASTTATATWPAIPGTRAALDSTRERA